MRKITKCFLNVPLICRLHIIKFAENTKQKKIRIIQLILCLAGILKVITKVNLATYTNMSTDSNVQKLYAIILTYFDALAFVKTPIIV